MALGKAVFFCFRSTEQIANQFWPQCTTESINDHNYKIIYGFLLLCLTLVVK